MVVISPFSSRLPEITTLFETVIIRLYVAPAGVVGDPVERKMPEQDDTTALVHGCLNRRDINIGVANAGHCNRLRHYVTGSGGHSSD
jgi:hypothetical protein